MSDEEVAFKPLTDQDVEEAMKRAANADQKEIVDVYNKYSQTLQQILTAALKHSKDDEDQLVEIDRIKRIINLCPLEERFIRSKDKIWAARDHIRKENAKYFIEKDYSFAIKKDRNQVMLESLIEVIRDKYSTLKPQEKAFYWEKMKTMLTCVERYKKAIKEE